MKKVIFIGDIIGKPGRDALRALLPNLKSKLHPDMIVANGENSAGGFGITREIASELFNLGIDVVTSGNHIWDKKEAVEFIKRETRVLRPLNYPPGVPGNGSYVHSLDDGSNIAVINVSGRVYMANYDCPFRTTMAEVERLGKITNNIIVDFHAEATSEKVAFGYWLDGRVSAVVGTHTHVQTADERVLGGGTAYISDVGMTGPVDSIIGVDKEQIIDRFLTLMPRKFETAKGPSVLCAVLLEIDEKTGRAASIKRLQIHEG